MQCTGDDRIEKQFLLYLSLLWYFIISCVLGAFPERCKNVCNEIISNYFFWGSLISTANNCVAENCFYILMCLCILCLH